MKTIVKGHRDYGKFFAMQKTKKEGTDYYPSAYLLRRETADGTLLCNTLTGELALLSEEERTWLDRLPSRACAGCEDLIRSRIAVPEGLREEETVDQLRELMLKRLESKKRITCFNILPTTYCNAWCFCCYENGIRHVNMYRETADRLADFIEQNSGGEKVKLNWFGGEPTVGRHIIDHICRTLEDRKILFDSKMISNAYLFDADLVKHAKECWKLRYIQITLDGTEEIYNRTKAYVNACDNPYRRVLGNIGCFLDEKVRVDIRLNMDSHNAEDLTKLIEELAELFGGRKHLFVYVRQLDDGAGFAPIRHREEELEGLKRHLIDLQELLDEKGWPQFRTGKLPMLRITSCMADDPCCVQCTPDGILSKCEDQIYDHAVGTLEKGVSEYEQVLWWRQRTAYEGCTDCPLYPSCIRLLKHCQVKNDKCTDYERKRMIDGVLDLMLHEYENRDKTGNESGSNDISYEAGRTDH